MFRPKYRAAFSYYGSKSNIARLYDSPERDLIIEPFAGSAAYAVRYGEYAKVWLNDLNEETCEIWRFLISPHSQADLLHFCPESVSTSQTIGDIIPAGAPEGLKLLLRAEAVRGTQGMEGRPLKNKVAKFAAQSWATVRQRLLWASQRCQHWKITNLDYRALPDLDATWFVDPPYSNAAGSRYKHHAIDYEHLGQWCRARQGHVIVCENLGATWLPFTCFCTHRGLRAKAAAYEAVYTQGGVSLWDLFDEEPGTSEVAAVSPVGQGSGGGADEVRSATM
jgi:hypothetical protein